MSDKKGFPLRLDPEIYDALQHWAASEFRSVNGQIEYLLRAALRDAGRLPGIGSGTHIGDRRCKEEAHKIVPHCRGRCFGRRRRQVRPNSSGAVVLVAAVALIVGGLWGGVELYRRATGVRSACRPFWLRKNRSSCPGCWRGAPRRRRSTHDRALPVLRRWSGTFGRNHCTAPGSRSLSGRVASGDLVSRV